MPKLQVILLEGPRGAGKSTVGRLLVDKLKAAGKQATYFKKAVRRPDNEFNNMMEHIMAWKQTGGIFVVDRFAITEWVMSVVHDRCTDYELLTDECQIALFSAIEDGIAFILTASNRVLEKRMKERGEDGRIWDMDPAIVAPIWRAAAGVFEVALLDTTYMTLEETVDTIYRSWIFLESGRGDSFVEVSP